MHRVQRLKDASMMASKFRDAEFSVYQKEQRIRGRMMCPENTQLSSDR